MLYRLENTIKTSFMPTIQKQLIVMQALTNKVLTVALRILKAFRDLLLYIPHRIFKQNIHLKPVIIGPIHALSFPNQDGRTLDKDILSLVLTYVANPNVERISKGVTKASFQSYRLIFEELEKEQGDFLSLLIKQTIIDYPIKSEDVEEVCKERLKQIYCTVMSNAKRWPGHEEIFAVTKSQGPLSSKRLREIAEWTTDQHLIYIFKILAPHSPQTRQYLSILDSTLSSKEKAGGMRQWLCGHPHAFDGLTSLIIRNDAQPFRLTEIPKEISYLKNLQFLCLFSNAIQFLPDSIGQLTQLQELNLGGNQLKTLFNSIGQLTQLQKIDLRNNQLQSLPDSIGQLTQLQELNLGSNQLQSLPDSIGQLLQLQELYLWHNRLRELPNSIGQLLQLRKLELWYNQLQRLPDSIGQLLQLQNFDLAYNELRRLPDSIGQLPQLQTITLKLNPLIKFPNSMRELIHTGKVSYDRFDARVFRFLTWRLNIMNS